MGLAGRDLPSLTLIVLALCCVCCVPCRAVLCCAQVGGYVQSFHGLTFATVRNAGHMVPYVQPLRALDLVTRFLADQPL